MIILKNEMEKSSLLFSVVDPMNPWKKPKGSVKDVHVIMGSLGGDSIVVYMEDWEEFFGKVIEIDHVMQEKKAHYESLISKPAEDSAA